MKDTQKNNTSVNDALVSVQKALVGIADLEEGVVKKIKEHLDKLLDNIYLQVKEYKNIAAKELMISENSITDADRALLAQGLAGISDKLAEKNHELLKLQTELKTLGIDVGVGSKKSLSALRQSLAELNKRNRILRQIQRELAKHPMITGNMPRKGISFKDVEMMFKALDKQIQTLHQANYVLKQQMKPQSGIEQKAGKDQNDNEDDNTPRMKR